MGCAPGTRGRGASGRRWGGLRAAEGGRPGEGGAAEEGADPQASMEPRARGGVGTTAPASRARGRCPVPWWGRHGGATACPASPGRPPARRRLHVPLLRAQTRCSHPGSSALARRCVTSALERRGLGREREETSVLGPGAPRASAAPPEGPGGAWPGVWGECHPVYGFWDPALWRARWMPSYFLLIFFAVV